MVALMKASETKNNQWRRAQLCNNLARHVTEKIMYNTCLSERKEKEMKEAYEVAEMEIIEFETEDVITTSQIGGGGEGFGE